MLALCTPCAAALAQTPFALEEQNLNPVKKSAQTRAGGLELSGYISSWTQEFDGGNWAPPVPASVNNAVSLALAEVTEPGTFSLGKYRQIFQLNGAALRADIALFAICPGYSAVTGGKCDALYYQAQATLSGATDAFCTATLNAADMTPFPVMTCAGKNPAHATQKLGITLHRIPFSK